VSGENRENPRKSEAPSTANPAFEIGQALNGDAFGPGGVLLLARGRTIRTQAQLERLRQEGIGSSMPCGFSSDRCVISGNTALGADVRCRLEDEFSGPLLHAPDVEQEPVAPEIPYAEEIVTAQAVRRRTLEQVGRVVSALQRNEPVDFGDIRSTAQSVLDSLQRNERALLSLLQLQTRDAYTFTHSVNCCVLSIIIAQRVGLSNRVLPISVGALLHDIGKMHLPSSIIRKSDILTPKEWDRIYRHPALGVEIVRRLGGGDSRFCSLEGIAHHHERLDGSGYPRNLNGDSIALEGRIVAVADVYDAMTSDRTYREAISAPSAAQWIHENAGVLFDPACVDALIDSVGVFPIGSLVRLNTGAFAIVVKGNRHRPLRPIILVVSDEAEQPLADPELLDLAETADTASKTSIVSLEDASAIGIDIEILLSSVDEENLLHLEIDRQATAVAPVHLDALA